MKKMINSRLFNNYTFWLILIVVLAVITRFMFLWYPAQVVFDEVHFGKFVASYYSGKYYFDIHPPLGKLLIAGFAKVWGFGGNFDFDKIGEAFSGYDLFILRFLPALFGTLFVYLIYKFTMALTGSKRASLIAAALVLFDNAFLVEAKFILVDSMLYAFGILALYLFVSSQKSKDLSRRHLLLVTLAGLAAGAALSIKWTGLAFPGLVLLFLFVEIFRKKRFFAGGEEVGAKQYPGKLFQSRSLRKKFGRFILKAALFSGAAFCVYAMSFYIHFSLLTQSGPGDAFMTPEFQKTLQGNSNENAELQTPAFWQKFVELNRIMYSANAGLKASHPFSSMWYEWPVCRRPIYYWAKGATDSQGASDIWLIGNPAGWLLAALALLMTFIGVFFKFGRRQINEASMFLLVGYFANLLPYIGVARIAFLYHYLPALTFALIYLAVRFDSLFNTKKSLVIFMLLLAAFFLFLAPISYGLPVFKQWHDLESSVVQFFS